MTLRDRIRGDLTASLKAGRKDALRTLRMLESALKNKEIELRRALEEAEVVQAIQGAIKQRREAIALYERGGRQDLVAQEGAEVEVLSDYLPQQLSDAELEAMVDAAIEAVGAAGPKDLGAVMKQVMGAAAGRVDGARVNAVARARLAHRTA